MRRITLGLGLAVALISGCGADKSESWTDGELAKREEAVVIALDNYCESIEYRAEICQITLPQGFGDPR